MRFSASLTTLPGTANPTMPPKAVTVWHSRSPDETRSLARGLAAAFVRHGAVVSLVGSLGAGKTEFAKGLAEGLGLGAEALASPTFTIASELPLVGSGPRRLVHADWFRVGSLRELEAAGLDDWLGSDAVLVVEWGDRFPEALGPGVLHVRFEETAPSERRVTAAADGCEAAALLARWEEGCR
jgi:tRNA threonylcarbamoyladenosine biosynthesis protein TsaE